ncbi:MAG: cytochrome b/b6 domain-containing protein [Kofleriaceae bacterium]
MKQFAWSSRILHWLMAAMLIAMLFIGVHMVVSVDSYHRLLAIHRPLGLAILVLALVRIINRRLTTLPDFLPTMTARDKTFAHYSELLLYALMVAMPLVGWGMQSAGGYPIFLHVLPTSPGLYSVLRPTHTVLAYLLFATFIAHLGNVLRHTIVIRDGELSRMLPWRSKK